MCQIVGEWTGEAPVCEETSTPTPTTESPTTATEEGTIQNVNGKHNVVLCETLPLSSLDAHSVRYATVYINEHCTTHAKIKRLGCIVLNQ